MTEHEAVFEIDSKSDAYAVERLMERIYDTIREEAGTTRGGSLDSTDALSDFGAIREATRDPTPGRLTLTYESRDETFED